MGLPELRSALRAACRGDEQQCVTGLLAEADGLAGDHQAAAQMARQLVAGEREHLAKAAGISHLLHEFALSSQEGVALMCLAEALLRIPDKATVDLLIREKIGHGDWKAHLAGEHPLFVNAATWGLVLTGKLVTSHHHGALGQALSRLLARGGEPLIRKGVDYAMRLLGEHFVMGQTITAALARSRGNAVRGYRHSFDMLGEAALTEAAARSYCGDYATAIHAIGAAGGGGVIAGPGISIKLSALHPRYVRSQRGRVLAELLPRLLDLMRLAKEYDIGVNIDAEEADRLELSLDIFERLAGAPELAGWDGFGFVVQAYQKRAPALIDWLVEVARRSGRRLMVRLVKGAYWDSEIKHAQVGGQADYPVFTRKAHTDLAYLVCAGRLLAAPDAVYPQFATHNAQTLATVFHMAAARGVEDYEFQCLHGMGEALYDQVVGPAGLGKACRIYAPVGTHRTLLPYLVRRLLENGANSSFVNRIVDNAVSIDQLVENPADSTRREGGSRHPKIPLPSDLYGPGRLNSAGTDLADEAMLTALADELQGLAGKSWRAQPLLAASAVPPGRGTPRPVFNPANERDQVGRVIDAEAADIESALAAALAFAQHWFETPPAVRAAMLQRAADLLEAHRAELVSLAIREAGKTWPNALGEVREAVDFCRYYAQQLLLADFRSAAAPGPVACISPWNFPLAIFMGQVSAALAAGSPVLAKPAEQTPLIAALAVELLHRAGVPAAALQLLPGPGETVGAALTGDARVRGVVFTGSGEVAQAINQRIAGRDDVRLIAETGGQNAMIVDSSALPEQVVQDVLVSGFDSAGQRCSALRVLCLQREIAEPVLEMLKAAMRELCIGDPALLATDIGPVIDCSAQAALQAHIAGMAAQGRAVFQLPVPADGAAGLFVPPTLIEIASPADLPGEVFGPVVHVLRFDAGPLDALIDAINATGYGLTMGVHSRIDETIQRITERARVGNIYVNRNMVGAVVGVQPFGGEGRSGTGPKAGGPLYLHRLAGTAAVAPASLGAAGIRPGAAAPLSRLAKWARLSGQRELAQLCTEFSRQTLLGATLELPGPTGERNTLHFVPRGTMLCLAADRLGLLRQLAAVWATGNAPATIDCLDMRQAVSGLADELAAAIEWRAPHDYRGLAGVLFDAEALLPADWRQRLAAEPGPLIATYRAADRSGHYPLYRMLAERVVTVNTTAAGGNTTLMML